VEGVPDHVHPSIPRLFAGEYPTEYERMTPSPSTSTKVGVPLTP
jgi:hypothetical protein